MPAIFVNGFPMSHLSWNGESLDFIGDVHGCPMTLRHLLLSLGYRPNEKGIRVHPEGRIPVFLGDLIDKGSDSYGVLEIVVPMVEAGAAKYVPGNHCDKLYRLLRGNSIKMSEALKDTFAQIQFATASSKAAKSVVDGFIRMVADSPSHLVLDGGNVVAVHAAVTEETIGIHGKSERAMNLYGVTDQGLDEKGYPKRLPTSKAYRGKSLVIHGHIKNPAPVFENNVLDIDTGCGYFDGALTAYRYPEGGFVSVPVADGVTDKEGCVPSSRKKEEAS